jgi:dTDP-4-dehydrorhamnose reductase
MKPRILLIGKNGQIGSELAYLLPEIAETIAVGRQELDLANILDIRAVIRQVCPSLIVNAAAYTAVDHAEQDETTARLVNAEAPAVMAEEANQIGAALVHYSTDYVFDGRTNSPYEECDLTNPLNVYGQTKLAGEVAIRKSGVPHLIFRTAWVYSTSGKNFLLTILRLASQREELRVVRDQSGAPTWSREIAQATGIILKQIAEQKEGVFDFSGIGGTYHMTAAGVTTWYDFAVAILEETSHLGQVPACLASATNGVPLRAERIIPITTDQYPTAAVRPAYSVLSNALLKKTFSVSLREWRVQLHAAFWPN